MGYREGTSRWTIGFAAVYLVLSATVTDATSEPVMFGGPTMGTTYHVRLVEASNEISVPQLKGEIESLLAEVDRQMSTWRLDSELSRFNRAAAGEWFPVSAATADVVSAAQAISEQTDGAMDVTVGPLVRLWHFGPGMKSGRRAKTDFAPPSDELLQSTKKTVGYRKLEVRTNPPALRKTVHDLEVDLSSIAPGYTVDRMAAILSEHNVRDFMVEIGGEVRAAGRRSDGKPWRIAIERPVAKRREMLRAIPLEDAAVSTAGDYRKFYEHEGRRYSHIIDPATGRPVEHSLVSVTVVAETCLEADGWDTPLLVLGPERGFECAEKNGLAALFVSSDDNGNGDETIRATPAWLRQFPSPGPGEGPGEEN
jgi:thiamine biosynthesis lipoprotein